ncbi:ABC transporter family protein (macronuclear) [Tetrahymena thermophila SB210]|uniref:ABC transporter family protein n=1 Tax=Tetrahymena thermophila (strain SB210) TaxID=312017 RepID=I7LVH2_TETTS|nr:ABC transporter family protein [Tetrahymena thermophila SB210]EAR98222.2 ABC transporter family protein [Tetrahymena thermophila SB210]|eukprot:XP_001018467.2 ABC transporter family protein [Tetrahymena thermophila SB210]
MKATLQYLIFKRSLKQEIKLDNQIDKKGQKENTEKASQSPEILNLMTVDQEHVLEMYFGIIETTSGILILAIALYLIYLKIGSSVLTGIYVMIGALFFNMILTIFLGVIFQVTLKRKDERVQLTKDVLSGIKNIKYFGWQQIFENKISLLRQKEQKSLLQVRIMFALVTMFWSSISYILLYTFLIKYVDDDNSIQQTNVFTIIALFGYLTQPLSSLPWAVSSIIQSFVSFNRINQFVNSEVCLIDRNSQIQEDNDFAIEIINKKFDWSFKNRLDKDQHFNEIDQDQLKKNDIENQSDINLNEELKSRLVENHESSQINNVNSEKNNFEIYIPSLKIKKGTLNFIIGEIGSGKSSLLLAVLGEMNEQNLPYNLYESSQSYESYLQTQGQNKIILGGKISYVSQNHWLQNKSIRDNILFGKEHDEQWYNICLDACQLLEDLNSFKNRDQKLVGPDGSNLSGGQKQRIAICRAVYSKSNIYLFDDIFSSLDIHVADQIYEKVIQQILINQLKCTVLFVTSHYKIIQQSDASQNIIYIEKGIITLDKDIIANYLSKSESFLSQNILSNSLSKEKLSSIQNQNNFKFQIKSNKQFLKEEEEKIDDNEKDDVEEKREKGNIKWETYLTYLKSLGLILFLLFVLLEITAQASFILIDFWLKDQSQDINDRQLSFLNDYFHGFRNTFTFLILANLAFQFFKMLIYVFSTQKSCCMLFKNLNQSIMRSKMKFFDENPSGRIINRVSEDLIQVDQALPFILLILITQISTTLWYAIGICIQLPWIILLFFIGFFMTFRIQKNFKVANREIKRLLTVNEGKLLNQIQESCKGLIIIRAFSQQKQMLQNYLDCLYNYSKSYLLSQGLQAWIMIRLLMINSLILGFIVITAIFFIFFQLTTYFSTVSMCLTYAMTISAVFCELIFSFFNLEQILVSVERLRQYFDNYQEQPEIKICEQDTQPITQSSIKKSKQIKHTIINDIPAFYSEDNRENYHLIFDNVFLSYDKQDYHQVQKNEVQVEYPVSFALKGLSFKIKKGEKVAFYGRTGSGKTSVLNALFNLYQIEKGNIYIENRNIKLLSINELRSKLSIIPQFGFVYEGTLLNNLDPLNQMQKEDILQILNQSQLNIKGCLQDTHFNSKQNNLNENEDSNNNNNVNLDLQIQQSGQNLSNGEKQIINFFRILLQKADIVCLDEATSNMDPHADKLLHKHLFEFSKNKTLIVIAHRLENIKNFDRVFVMDSGNIVEQGHIDQLIQHENGFFSHLKETL